MNILSKNKKMKMQSRVLGYFFVLSFLFFGSTLFAAGESKFYLETKEKILAPGSEFNVSVYIDSDTPVNAVDVEIGYPTDKLQFIDYNNAKSIIDLWQTNPKYLSNGNVGFSGGILKGWSGKKGSIVTLSFRAKDVGTATIYFPKKDLYLADGMGTKTFAESAPITISVKENAKEVVIEPIKTGDKTPPDLVLTVVKNKGENNTLVVWSATDPESGIKNTEIRFKKWFKYGEWVIAENTMVYPIDAWQIELRTMNNEGISNIKFFSSPMKIVYKVILILFAVIFLVYVSKWVYNKMKSRSTMKYEA